MLDFQKLLADYQQALLRQIVPFWLKHSRDEQCGGYFDTLSAAGEVIESDKFVTPQAQQVWAFAWLYNTLDGQLAWLNHAQHGATFLSQFAHDTTLNSYSQLDRRGRPVAEAADLIPSSATILAYVQMHRATGNDEWAMLAKQIFTNVYQQWQTSRDQQDQSIGGLRLLRHLSEPVALLKGMLAMQPLLAEEVFTEMVENVLYELLNTFLDRRSDTLREYTLPEGAFSNTPEGRRINIGLTFQVAGYLLDFCEQTKSVRNGLAGQGNRKLAKQAIQWCLKLCAQAWDELEGGLNPYADIKGQPIIFPDWQQKWAWVQLEALNTLMKGYFYHRQSDCLKWFKRIHDYTFHHFPDLNHTGWHLALDRSAQPLLSAKALPSVGCFSAIRCLTETMYILKKCEQIQPVRSVPMSASFNS